MSLLRSLIKKLSFVVNYHLCWKQANYRDSKSDTDNDIWTSCILDIKNSCQQRKNRVLRDTPLTTWNLKKTLCMLSICPLFHWTFLTFRVETEWESGCYFISQIMPAMCFVRACCKTPRKYRLKFSSETTCKTFLVSSSYAGARGQGKQN